MRYRLNTPEVASETLDKEVIVIHLKSGNYYSLRGSAVEIWTAVIAGWTEKEIVDRLAQSKHLLGDEVAAHVRDVVAYIATENLILPCNSEEHGAILDMTAPEVFIAPLIQKFTDMQELLLIDPIHEVSDAGWPEQLPSRT